MRILIAHNSYQQRGGEDAVVENERDLLAGAGHEVETLLVSNDSIKGTAAGLKAALGVAYSGRSRELAACRIAAFRPDVLQVHNFFPLLTPAIYDAARDAGVPVVQTLHNFRITCAAATLLRDGKVCEQCIGGSPYQAVRYRCYRGSIPGSAALAHMIASHRRAGTWQTKVDRYFALTEFARSRFIAAGLPPDRIIVKPNFAPPAAAGAGAARRSGALFVGRLSSEKGVRELVQAWQHVEHPLRIAGDGPLAAELRRSAPPTVTFLGSIGPDRIKAEMAEAAALIVPSTWYEGFPMVIAEAYAVGLPVLASRIGSLAEIVADGETGRHFAPGDPADLVRVAREALADSESLQRYSAAARARFEMRYSARAALATLENTYRGLARTAGRQSSTQTPAALPEGAAHHA
jgi:glycosyltransferase involved in cell wall biosynthesis